MWEFQTDAHLVMMDVLLFCGHVGVLYKRKKSNRSLPPPPGSRRSTFTAFLLLSKLIVNCAQLQPHPTIPYYVERKKAGLGYTLKSLVRTVSLIGLRKHIYEFSSVGYLVVVEA